MTDEQHLRVEAVIHHRESSAFISLWDVVALVTQLNVRDLIPLPPFSSATDVVTLKEVSPIEAAALVEFLESTQSRERLKGRDDQIETMLLDRFDRAVAFFKTVSAGNGSAMVIG